MVPAAMPRAMVRGETPNLAAASRCVINGLSVMVPAFRCGHPNDNTPAQAVASSHVGHSSGLT